MNMQNFPPQEETAANSGNSVIQIVTISSAVAGIIGIYFCFTELVISGWLKWIYIVVSIAVAMIIRYKPTANWLSNLMLLSVIGTIIAADYAIVELLQFGCSVVLIIFGCFMNWLQTTGKI